MFEAARYDESRIRRIQDGRTPVYCIGEDGSTLVLRDAEGAEIRRATLDLVPGAVETVRY